MILPKSTYLRLLLPDLQLSGLGLRDVRAEKKFKRSLTPKVSCNIWKLKPRMGKISAWVTKLVVKLGWGAWIEIRLLFPYFFPPVLLAAPNHLFLNLRTAESPLKLTYRQRTTGLTEGEAGAQGHIETMESVSLVKQASSIKGTILFFASPHRVSSGFWIEFDLHGVPLSQQVGCLRWNGKTLLHNPQWSVNLNTLMKNSRHS